MLNRSAHRVPRQLIFGCILFFIAVGPTYAEGQTGGQATLTWDVSVPEGTPADTVLFIAGNVPELGPWRPDAFPMQRTDKGRFRAQLQVPVGTELEYKFTRGSWGSVEKTVDGAEVPNRRWRVAGDAVIDATISAWAKPAIPRANTGVGDLRWRKFSSEHLKSDRRITVWLPPQYQQSDAMRFPVVYLLDGQNVFDAARAAFGVEWQADETAKELADSFAPLILVAVDNSPERMDEYTPVTHTMKDRIIGGDADRYLHFLCDELKPWIDGHFPTRTEPEYTTLVGSSLGGLLVLHALTTRSDVFGNGIAMSPSLFWGDGAALRSARSWNPTSDATGPLRLWIDMGTREGKSEEGRKQLIDSAMEIESALRGHGEDLWLVRFFLAEGAEHNEHAWSMRIGSALRFAALGGLESP